MYPKHVPEEAGIYPKHVPEEAGIYPKHVPEEAPARHAQWPMGMCLARVGWGHPSSWARPGEWLVRAESGVVPMVVVGPGSARALYLTVYRVSTLSFATPTRPDHTYSIQ